MLEREFLKNIVSTSSLKIVGMGVGYAVYLLSSRFYGPEQLGRFFITLAVIAFASRITAAGVGSGLAKFIPGIYADQGKAATNGFILRSIVPTLIVSPAIIVFLVFNAKYISITMFHDEGVIPFIKVMSLALLADAMINIICGCFTAVGMPKTSAFGEAAAFNIVFLVVMTVSYLLLNSQAMCLAYIFSMYFCVLSLAGYWFYKNGISIEKTSFSYQEFFSVSLPVMFAGMTRAIDSWAGILILGMYCDALDVGVYGIVSKVAGLASVILVSSNTILASKMSLLWFRDEKEELQKLIRKSTIITVLLTIPVILFLILFSEMVLQTFGNQFVLGKWTLIILLIGQLINVASGPLSHVMCLTVLQKEYGRLVFSASAVNVILNLVFVPRWGMEGAAVASGVAMIYLTAMQLWLVYTRLGIKTDIVSLIAAKWWN